MNESLGTHAGQILPQGTPEAPDEAGRALMDAALGLLRARPYSAEEMRTGLARRRGQAGPEEVDAVVARLSELGLLDDAALAAREVEKRRAAGESRAGIARRLRMRGLDGVTVEEALAGAPGDETEAAREAAERRLARMGSLAPAAKARRLGSYLTRLGYGHQVVREVLAGLLEEHGAASG